MGRCKCERTRSCRAAPTAPVKGQPAPDGPEWRNNRALRGAAGRSVQRGWKVTDDSDQRRRGRRRAVAPRRGRQAAVSWGALDRRQVPPAFLDSRSHRRTGACSTAVPVARGLVIETLADACAQSCRGRYRWWHRGIRACPGHAVETVEASSHGCSSRGLCSLDAPCQPRINSHGLGGVLPSELGHGGEALVVKPWRRGFQPVR